MRTARVKVAIAVAGAALLGGGAAAVAASGDGERQKLTGFEEVPALSTPGVGEFRADIGRNEIRYRLSFSNLESSATQAHIHFENETNNGPIVVFLCTNLPEGPPGTQACPAGGGAVTGTIRAANVGAGAAGQGLDAGQFDELVRAIRAGATYVNVHTEGRPSGEIRAQLGDGHARDQDHSGQGRDGS